MNKGYLIFSIGPVQDFIAKARKAQDFYNGSFLLSYLSSVAWDKLQESLTPVYPKENPKGKGASIPNVMLFEADKKDAESEATRAERAVMQECNRIKNEIFQSPAVLEKAEEQLANFPEIYWAWGKEKDEVQRFHAAAKRARIFSQIERDRRSQKCSTCGQMEAIFYRKKKGERKTPRLLSPEAEVFEYDDQSIPLKFLSPGEALCAVCFEKRLLERANLPNFKKEFPSTAEIALMNVEKANSDLFKKYKGVFKGVHFDYQLFYKENLTEKYFEAEGLPLEILKKAGEAQKKLEDLKLPRYYAVFLADGDNMGKHIAEGDAEEISSELLKFAASVKDRITFPAGRWIYAGGDDVLAFLNLSNALEKIEEVRRLAFPKFSTLSAALVIAHYKAPLSEVLRHGRETLKNSAKNVEEKAALAIEVLRHSGERTLSLLKWDALENVLSLLKFLLSGEVTTNFIYSLKELHREVTLLEEQFSALSTAYIGRSIPVGKEKTAEEVHRILMELYSKMVKLRKRKENEEDKFDPIDNFFQLLDNIAFLRRELKEGK